MVQNYGTLRLKPLLQLNSANCWLPKWEAKNKHGVSFAIALPKALEQGLKQKTVYQDSSKYALLGLSLEIELTISFAPSQDTQDISQFLTARAIKRSLVGIGARGRPGTCLLDTDALVLY
ncbi:hypothetical protein TNCV_2977101 [Trichonephila clavipes]|nr:hypothetical protein TNCV_2977101 [Trichonephila clavipes]